MLTSSDAKFRCLWHMFIWSIMLTLVSQFYVLSDHIAFYIFGSICILVLPIVTSLYSNTAGRRGAGLLRVAYVLCDPVIACMALVPVLLINRLTPLISEMECLSEDIHSWNQSIACLRDQTSSNHFKLRERITLETLPFRFKTAFWLERRRFLTAIELSVTIPCILALLMGRRTRKMNSKTALLVFAYWLVASIECCGMVEASVLCGSDRLHYAVTTEVTVSIACILANSYGLVTLCSFISPMRCKGDKEQVAAHFDLVYKAVVGVLGVAFVELPQLIARIQMLFATSDWPSASEVSSFIKESQAGGSNGEHYKQSRHMPNDDSSITDLNDTTHFNETTIPPPFNISSIFSHLLSNLYQNFPSNTLPNNISANLSTIPPPATHSTIPPPATHSTIPTTTHPDKLYRLGFPPSFYLWVFKDAIMIIIIITLLVLQRLGRSPPEFMRILGEGQGCVGAAFDNLNTVFVPEKRDKYIITRCAKCRQIDVKGGATPYHRNHHRSIHLHPQQSTHHQPVHHPTHLRSTLPQISLLIPLDNPLKETSFSVHNNSEQLGKNKVLMDNSDHSYAVRSPKEINNNNSNNNNSNNNNSNNNNNNSNNNSNSNNNNNRVYVTQCSRKLEKLDDLIADDLVADDLVADDLVADDLVADDLVTERLIGHSLNALTPIVARTTNNAHVPLNAHVSFNAASRLDARFHSLDGGVSKKKKRKSVKFSFS